MVYFETLCHMLLSYHVSLSLQKIEKYYNNMTV